MRAQLHDDSWSKALNQPMTKAHVSVPGTDMGRPAGRPKKSVQLRRKQKPDRLICFLNVTRHNIPAHRIGLREDTTASVPHSVETRLTAIAHQHPTLPRHPTQEPCRWRSVPAARLPLPRPRRLLVRVHPPESLGVNPLRGFSLCRRAIPPVSHAPAPRPDAAHHGAHHGGAGG